jgi:hypothetical protein
LYQTDGLAKGLARPAPDILSNHASMDDNAHGRTGSDDLPVRPNAALGGRPSVEAQC